jgi:hypothetical protein
MCRSIKTLRTPQPASDDEVHAAALQFVRKVSGFRQPSSANEAAFNRAVAEIARVSRRLLDDLPPARPRRPAEPSATTSGASRPRSERPAALR